MEHAALGEVVLAFESIGVKFRDANAYVPCRRCKRTRRFAPNQLAAIRGLSLLFCLDCLKSMQLATTLKTQTIV